MDIRVSCHEINSTYRPMSNILSFLNSHEDWEERLTRDFQIRTSWDGDYFLLKYETLGAPFEEPLVRECRGSIFRWDEINARYICVCAPFTKFFNNIEPLADEIDWESAFVSEKIDGSLIKVWFDDGWWHVSTNGMIDAWDCYSGDISFGSIFSRICKQQNIDITTFDTNYTYMFELTSPESQVCISYPDDIWFIGCRDMRTMNEVSVYDYVHLTGVKCPRRYEFNKIEDCIWAVENFGEDQEGVVVCDSNFHRVKIKGKAYLKIAKLRGNGIFTMRRFIEMWKDNQLDDFIAACPQFKDKVFEFNELIDYIISEMWDYYSKDISTFVGKKKDFAKKIKNYPKYIKAYLFKSYDYYYGNNKAFYNPVSHVQTMGVAQIERMIEECLISRD